MAKTIKRSDCSRLVFATCDAYVAGRTSKKEILTIMYETDGERNVSFIDPSDNSEFIFKRG